jgi:hypothetical protein
MPATKPNTNEEQDEQQEQHAEHGEKAVADATEEKGCHHRRSR